VGPTSVAEDPLLPAGFQPGQWTQRNFLLAGKAGHPSTFDFSKPVGCHRAARATAEGSAGREKKATLSLGPDGDDAGNTELYCTPRVNAHRAYGLSRRGSCRGKPIRCQLQRHLTPRAPQQRRTKRYRWGWAATPHRTFSRNLSNGWGEIGMLRDGSAANLGAGGPSPGR